MNRWTGIALVLALSAVGCAAESSASLFVDLSIDTAVRPAADDEVAWWEAIVKSSKPPPAGVVSCDLPADVLFESGDPTLTSTGQATVRALAPMLATAIEIEITGHTDGTPMPGTPVEPDGNVTLSRGRANSAKDELVTAGIDATRISTSGAGSSEQKMPENVGDDDQRAEARQANRRVEITARFPADVPLPEICPELDRRLPLTERN